MKIYFKCLTLILFIGLMITSGCLNSYETQITGYYEVDKFEYLDSTKAIDLPVLILKQDKTFELSLKDKKIVGKWEADDYRDFTVADFTFNDRFAQGKLLGKKFEKIEIVNPLDFYINAKSFTFKRVRKT